jgi:hypothetical protein
MVIVSLRDVSWGLVFQEAANHRGGMECVSLFGDPVELVACNWGTRDAVRMLWKLPVLCVRERRSVAHQSRRRDGRQHIK